MRVNPTDSIPAVTPDQTKGAQRIEPRPAQPVVGPAAHLEIAHTDATNVVVQIQNDNKVVYRIIDAGTGKLIEQIPSQQMINFANAVDQALPSLNKPEGKK